LKNVNFRGTAAKFQTYEISRQKLFSVFLKLRYLITKKRPDFPCFLWCGGIASIFKIPNKSLLTSPLYDKHTLHASLGAFRYLDRQ
jgi:hypothetical protein